MIGTFDISTDETRMGFELIGTPYIVGGTSIITLFGIDGTSDSNVFGSASQTAVVKQGMSDGWGSTASFVYDLTFESSATQTIDMTFRFRWSGSFSDNPDTCTSQMVTIFGL